MNPAYEDAFNLLCYGKSIGSGTTRDVFQCRMRAEWVVKVEIEQDWRQWANVLEWKFWQDVQHASKITKWLAPCEMISPDGRILIQHRAEPLPRDYALPETLPDFLTDLKRENFGLIAGQLVCVDYALTCGTVSTRMRKVQWNA